MTGTEFLNLFVGKILHFGDLSTYFTDAIEQEQRRMAADLWAPGGTIDNGTGRVLLTAAANTLSLPAGPGIRDGWTGMGYRLRLDPADPVWQNQPYEATPFAAYFVGVREAKIPSAVEVGADGVVHYARTVENVGEIGHPDTVIDNLDGTVTLVLDTLAEEIWTGPETREVFAWLDVPVTPGSEAIWSGTCAYDGGSGSILATLPHSLGQGMAPSVDPADYWVLLRGFRVTQVDITLDPTYWYLGSVIGAGPAFNAMAQHLYVGFGVFASAFGAQHSPTTGVHLDVTARSLTAAGTPGKKIVAKAVDPADATANAMLQIEDPAATLMQMWADPAYAGRLRWPAAQLGVSPGGCIDVQDVTGVLTRTRLFLTNDRAATDYLDVVIDGILRWNPTKALNTWALECDAAADQTLYVRNIGLGLANLNVDGLVDVGDNVRATNGFLIAGAGGTFSFAARRSRAVVLPAFAWELVSGGAERSPTTTPPYVRSSSDTVAVVLVADLSWLWKDAADEDLVFDGALVRYHRNGGSDSIVLRLYSCVNDGVAAPAVERTWTASATGGWQTGGMDSTGDAIPLTVKQWWLELTIDPDSARADAEVEGVAVRLLQGSLG